MADEARTTLSHPTAAVILTAVGIFAAWQVVDHFLFMVLIPMYRTSMLGFHLTSLLGETIWATLLIAYFVRVLSRQNRKLLELDRQKGILLDALVHDLRQPLTAVIGGLSSLTASKELPLEMRQLADIAEEGALELLQMVNDLLDVTRLEAGQPLIDAQDIVPDDFIKRGVHVVEPVAAEKGLALTVDLPPNLPHVRGDAERLRRVVMNLAGNAVKFTERGGSISVSARADTERSILVVTVADTGCGIPAHAQRRIFEKFNRGVGASSEGRGSTGLGLYFCKLIVEAHGGKIWVESKPGEGSRFSFALPLTKHARLRGYLGEGI